MSDLSRYRGQKPWSVSIEITEGCNRRCTFCGIHSLYRDEEDVRYKFMTANLVRDIAKDLRNWLGDRIRFEFALQGEPLLNPEIIDILATLREELPRCQLMLTTNTDPLKEDGGLSNERIMALFGAGLNILTADYYDNPKHYPEFFAMFKEMGTGSQPIEVFDFYDDKRSPWAYRSSTTKEIIVIDSIMRHTGEEITRKLNNQAGNADPVQLKKLGYKIKPLPNMKRCANPYRELVIKHDGLVVMCCMDWQREHPVGKFPAVSFKDIWESDHMLAIRSLLYRGRRDLMSPCNRCDYGSYKVGLLEDPLDHAQDDSHDAKLAKTVKAGVKQGAHLMNKYASEPFTYELLEIKK